MAAAAHGPGDEGSSGHRRPEDDGGEFPTASECILAQMNQSMWEYDGCESTVATERCEADTLDSVGERE